MKACAEHGVSILVLDRPNPLGAKTWKSDARRGVYQFRRKLSHSSAAWIDDRRSGTILPNFARHSVELEVVAMQGWNRSMYYSELDRRWVAPSPNMPRLETTLLYPGQVLLEGTNLSEGRGTTLPFEMGVPPSSTLTRCVPNLSDTLTLVCCSDRFASLRRLTNGRGKVVEGCLPCDR